MYMYAASTRLGIQSGTMDWGIGLGGYIIMYMCESYIIHCHETERASLDDAVDHDAKPEQEVCAGGTITHSSFKEQHESYQHLQIHRAMFECMASLSFWQTTVTTSNILNEFIPYTFKRHII